MSERTDYPPGAPCWVDTMQPDPRAAANFYGALFGWAFDEAGGYLTARLDGRLVAGIGQAPAAPAFWVTYVRVESIESAIGRVTAEGGAILVGPMEASVDGRAAAVTDPTGVPFGLWEAHERIGAELVDEPGTWQMSALHTPNAEAAQAFYGAVFGWQLEPAPGAPFALWRLPGHAEPVAVMAPIEPGSDVPPHWAVNFRVADADATAERAVALGGTLLLEPSDTPGFRNAVIADPQQGVIAISEVRARQDSNL